MNIQLPLDVKNIIEILEENGHAAYIVGGCVRDFILGYKPKDWDITTSAKPEEVKKLFKRTIDTGIEHGTVTIMIGDNGYEVTTFRLDGDYLDGRHPENVEFTNDLSEDLRRRDFTINAMAYNESEGLIDLYGGIEDLHNRIIRCVGEPEERFSEDALRMMRAVRFAARFGFEIEPETYGAIFGLAPTLAKVSAERIRDEFMKIICSRHPEKMHDLYKLGLTRVFLPEWDAMEKTEQNTPHHLYKVGHHTIEVIKHLNASRDAHVLAAFLHDVGKPMCKTTDENGRDHFKGHAEIGVQMAVNIMRRLKFDNKTIKYVGTLVRYHDARPGNNPYEVRRLMSIVGKSETRDLIELSRADLDGQNQNYLMLEKRDTLNDFEVYYEEAVESGFAVSLGELEIKGSDLIELGVEPGPKMGEILKTCLDEVLKYPLMNTKGDLERIALDIINGRYRG